MLNEELVLETAGRMTSVASITINAKDSLWIARHHTGSGMLTEVYIQRNAKHLGRFGCQDIPTFDAAWESKDKVSDAELLVFRKVRMTMLTAVDKLWSA